MSWFKYLDGTGLVLTETKEIINCGTHLRESHVGRAHPQLLAVIRSFDN
jgi:hypothetical protein